MPRPALAPQNIGFNRHEVCPMSDCQPKTVIYRARSQFRASGAVPRYLMHDGRWPLWHWTKDATRQEEFRDYGRLIEAINIAGGPDGTGRTVIIETITHEEQEFDHLDHARWKEKQKPTLQKTTIIRVGL